MATSATISTPMVRSARKAVLADLRANFFPHRVHAGRLRRRIGRGRRVERDAVNRQKIAAGFVEADGRGDELLNPLELLGRSRLRRRRRRGAGRGRLARFVDDHGHRQACELTARAGPMARQAADFVVGRLRRFGGADGLRVGGGAAPAGGTGAVGAAGCARHDTGAAGGAAAAVVTGAEVERFCGRFARAPADPPCDSARESDSLTVCLLRMTGDGSHFSSVTSSASALSRAATFTRT